LRFGAGSRWLGDTFRLPLMFRTRYAITAITMSTTPTQRRKFSDCTSPPVRRRITAITPTTINSVFIAFFLVHLDVR
jgi:hypothetical protein